MRGQPPVRVLIRWESATPVREAARKPVPPLASQYYIITVSGLPASGHDPNQEREDSEGVDTRKHLEDQLIGSTELLRKGKDPIHPERLQVLDKQGQGLAPIQRQIFAEGNDVSRQARSVTRPPVIILI